MLQISSTNNLLVVYSRTITHSLDHHLKQTNNLTLHYLVDSRYRVSRSHSNLFSAHQQIRLNPSKDHSNSSLIWTLIPPYSVMSHLLAKLSGVVQLKAVAYLLILSKRCHKSLVHLCSVDNLNNNHFSQEVVISSVHLNNNERQFKVSFQQMHIYKHT